MATPTGPTDPTVGTTHDAPTTMETTGTQTSRKEFLGTAAKAVAGAAAAGAGLGVAPALAAGSRRLPEIMRKGSPVTLTYYFGANAAEAQTRQKIINQFMAANPDIKIVNQLDPNTPGAHLQKFNSEVAGGKPPDLTMSWELDYSPYANRGVLLDLNQFIKSDSQFQHEVLSQEYPAVLEMFSSNGRLYVLPEQVTDTVLYYNKDHVAAAGLKMPTSWNDKTWTWDKFLSYAQKLTQKRGSRVTRYGYAEMWVWGLTACNVVAAANGGNWFSQPVHPSAGASNLSDPKISQAVQWYADLTNKSNVAASFQALTSDAGFQQFMTGRASMGIVGHWFYNAFAGTKGLNFDIAPVPIGPGGDAYSRTNIGGTGISILAKTKYPEQCWRFVKYWAGLQGQQVIAQTGLWVPALKNIGQSAAYKQSNGAMQHATNFTTVLQEGYVHSLPISQAWPEFNIPWTNEMNNIWEGKKSVAQTMPALDKTINADIKKYA
jgi:multiple sugar transport system substrate-binding protein